jgi:hypothetical protein
MTSVIPICAGMTEITKQKNDLFTLLKNCLF